MTVEYKRDGLTHKIVFGKDDGQKVQLMCYQCPFQIKERAGEIKDAVCFGVIQKSKGYALIDSGTSSPSIEKLKKEAPCLNN